MWESGTDRGIQATPTPRRYLRRLSIDRSAPQAHVNQLESSVSAQLKAFQGPDVQLLLDRIRTELGPGVKIDGAERIRVGGVMGFFSKEHYRVVVEIPDGAGYPGSSASPLPASPLPEPPAEAAPAPGPTTAGAGALATAIDSTGTDTGPATSEPGTTGATVSDNHDLDDHNDGQGHATPDGFDEAPAAAPVADPEAVLDVFLAGFSPAGSSPAPDSPLVDSPADRAPAAVFPAEPMAPSPSVVLSSDGSVAEAWYDTTTDTSGPAANGHISDPHGLMAEALRHAGLEDAWAGSISEGLRQGGDLRSLLLHMFADLPPAPPVPRRAGSLLVVVGEGASARRLAAALADEIGGDSTAVPFASCQAGAHVFATGKLLVRSAEDAAELAPVWRREHAAVVVVDSAVTSVERSWANHMIAALRPTAVWGVVDATCKTEDVAEWARSLGGIDALALSNFNLTASPAAALGAGIPVARIDGQPATASRWVASVMVRVESSA